MIILTAILTGFCCALVTMYHRRTRVRMSSVAVHVESWGCDGYSLFNAPILQHDITIPFPYSDVQLHSGLVPLRVMPDCYGCHLTNIENERSTCA